MEWCKLWSEWGTDPKIQMMAEHMRCRHVMLLCLHCERPFARKANDMRNEEIAFYMRITIEEAEETRKLFVQKGFIDEKWNLLNWETRQSYVSPAAKRMKRVREQKRNALRNAFANGKEHVPLALAREEEKRREEKIEEPPNPLKRGKRPAVPAEPLAVPDWVPRREWKQFEEMRRTNPKVKNPVTLQAALDELTRLREEGHDPAVILRRSIMMGWAGLFAPDQPRNGKPHKHSTSQQTTLTDDQVDQQKKRQRAWEARQAAELNGRTPHPQPKAIPIQEPVASAPRAKLSQAEQLAALERMKQEDGTK